MSRNSPLAVAAYNLCGIRGSIAIVFTVRGVVPLTIPVLLNAQVMPPSVVRYTPDRLVAA